MKISITQVILGIVIVFACVYIAWWMLSGIDSLLDETIPGTDGNPAPDVTPSHESAFDIARYAFILTLGLALSVITSGAVWSRTDKKQALAVIQVICGTCITAVAVFIIICGCSFDYVVAIEGGPVVPLGSIITLTTLTGVLGLVITSLAVILLLQMKNTIPDKPAGNDAGNQAAPVLEA